VIALVSGLLALAGLLAERGVSVARRRAVEEKLAVRSAERPGRRIGRHLWWPAAALILLMVWGPAVAVGVGAGAFAVGRVSTRRRRAAERRRGEEQLADAVAAVSAGLRAGLSLSQALAYARDEAQSPLRDDLTRLVGRIEVGEPMGDALFAWAEDRGSEDARLIAGVLDLHRRSGGDLPAVLDGLVGTLRERRSAHREIRALTAQARLSGVILGMLPIGFFGFLLLTSRREMTDAMASPLGRTAVAVGLGLELLAFLWIRRLLEVR